MVPCGHCRVGWKSVEGMGWERSERNEMGSEEIAIGWVRCAAMRFIQTRSDQQNKLELDALVCRPVGSKVAQLHHLECEIREEEERGRGAYIDGPVEPIEECRLLGRLLRHGRDEGVAGMNTATHVGGRGRRAWTLACSGRVNWSAPSTTTLLLIPPAPKLTPTNNPNSANIFAEPSLMRKSTSSACSPEPASPFAGLPRERRDLIGDTSGCELSTSDPLCGLNPFHPCGYTHMKMPSPCAESREQ
jgi:hypothetical protein